jgi:quercetin dioxygenase-like cupin family protein
VLDGTLRYHIGGKDYDGAPGSVFHVPAGVALLTTSTGEHTFDILVGVVRAFGGEANALLCI